MIGRTISHYTLLEKLGEGGMGVVYKARDTKLDRTVALKFLPAESSFDPGARDRFLQEARAASALNHPNITTIYEIDEFEKQMFISMEFCEGKTLRQIIRSGRFPLHEAAEIAKQICEGLAVAHEKGIVHRDIKTDNIMLTPARQVKIMDFGLAKLRGASALTRTGSTIGTVGFMAPEQIRHESVDQRADIWSLGVVIFEMLTGELPFRGDHEAAIIYSILSEPPKEIRTLRPDVTPDMERLVARCLEKDSSARYQSAAEILTALRGPGSSPEGPGAAVHRGGRSFFSRRRPVLVALAIAAIFALAVIVYRLVDRSEHVRWAVEKAIPQVAQLVDERRLPEAYALAREAEHIVSDDSTLNRLMLQSSFRLTVSTTPAEATVLIKPYSASDTPWTTLGTTPISSLRLARDPSRLRIVRDGFLPVEAILAPSWDGGSFPAEDTLRLTLDPEGSHPGEMVRVSGGPTLLYLVGLEQEPPVVLGDFLLDRFEVTNREFKKFVDAGGYENQKYWKVPLRDGGTVLSWSEAIGRLHDATGRPGPAKWETGSYPDGHGDYPVNGVSWYEAAAYAEFAGKSLPTIFQWNHAAGTPRSVLIVPLGNFGPKGPAQVGTSNSMGPFGTYDMAGNVKEWVWNEGRGGNRYILGGGWGEPHYMFNDPDAQSPFKRDVTFGFRCARNIAADDAPGRTLGPVDFPARDFRKERPVSGGIFAVYKSLYSYDRTDLRAVVESRDTSAENWTRERISFAAAYGNERVIAFLFIPRKSASPYQTVVYFPGSNALHQRSIEFLEMQRIDLIIRSGRAVMYPVYKSTYERGDGLHSDVPDTTVSYRDHVIMWAKDCSRSIDYLQTRPDINTEKLAFLGVSWGAVIGHMITAVDHRFKAAVFVAGGLSVQRSLPEVEQMNFVSRIEAPALVLNGHYDFFFPVETSQIPMFNLLNIPESRKRKVVFESGHSVPRVESAREILDWLDRYLGPVR